MKRLNTLLGGCLRQHKLVPKKMVRASIGVTTRTGRTSGTPVSDTTVVLALPAPTSWKRAKRYQLMRRPPRKETRVAHQLHKLLQPSQDPFYIAQHDLIRPHDVKQKFTTQRPKDSEPAHQTLDINPPGGRYVYRTARRTRAKTAHSTQQAKTKAMCTTTKKDTQDTQR